MTKTLLKSENNRFMVSFFLNKTQTTGSPTYCSVGPSNILTHDLPKDLFSSSDRISISFKVLGNQLLLSVFHMTIILLLFCVLAVDQSNTVPRRRLAINV